MNDPAYVEPGNERRETIILVHGTFADPGPDPLMKQWWQKGSEFCAALDSLLADSHSPARCWSHVSGIGTFPFGSEMESIGLFLPEFSWSGANSEAARRMAGARLADYLEALEKDTELDRYHIIAHSHGGNVVQHALATLSKDSRKVGTVVYLGTPILRFGRSWLSRTIARINLALLAIAVGFGWLEILAVRGSLDWRVQAVIVGSLISAVSLFCSYFSMVAKQRKVPTASYSLAFAGKAGAECQYRRK
jgi:pimeloyl-ACP methyl ester carboxylesterase